MRKKLDLLYKAGGWGAALFLVAICMIVTGQVILNLIDKLAHTFTGTAIGLTIPSYGDFTGFFLASASFLALAYTLREGGHIRVTLFISHLSPRIRRPIEVWCIGLALFMTLYFTWYTGMLVHESYVYNDLSSGMVAVPIWVPQLGMLLGLVVLSIALVDEGIHVLRGDAPSYAEKGENLLIVADGSAENQPQSVAKKSLKKLGNNG